MLSLISFCFYKSIGLLCDSWETINSSEYSEFNNHSSLPYLKSYTYLQQHEGDHDERIFIFGWTFSSKHTCN